MLLRAARHPVVMLAALAVLVLLPVPAGAHGGIIPQPVVEAEPELEGLEATGIVTVAPQLLVQNTNDTPVTFLDDNGRPWLRISAAGVEADLSLRRWWEANDPSGVGQDPPAGAPEGWTLISTEPSFGWFPRELRPPTSPEQDHSWSIPAVVGDRTEKFTGTLRELELRGGWASRLEDAGQLDGAQVAVVSGTVPAMVLQRTGAAQVTVLGTAGEPMLRVSDTGFEANLASPTWHQHTRWDTAATEPSVPADADAEPVWEVVSASGGTATWLEPRGATGQVVPASNADEDQQLSFEVPIEVDGERTTVTGTTRWEGEGLPGEGLPAWLLPTAGVVAAALLAGAALRRRRRV